MHHLLSSWPQKTRSEGDDVVRETRSRRPSADSRRGREPPTSWASLKPSRPRISSWRLRFRSCRTRRGSCSRSCPSTVPTVKGTSRLSVGKLFSTVGYLQFLPLLTTIPMSDRPPWKRILQTPTLRCITGYRGPTVHSPALISILKLRVLLLTVQENPTSPIWPTWMIPW